MVTSPPPELKASTEKHSLPNPRQNMTQLSLEARLLNRLT